MRRVFFALWPSEEQQTALADAAQSALQAEGGRLVPALNFHVTLVFVGSVAAERMQELFKIAEHVSTVARNSREFGSGPLRLAFDAVGYWSKARIICATASTPSAAASALSEVLKSHLLAAGFAPDLKPFRPHVTLTRKVVRPIRPSDMPPVVWSFEEFVLAESKTDPQGAAYRVLESFPVRAVGHAIRNR
jgi:2'-5' RNA ligase